MADKILAVTGWLSNQPYDFQRTLLSVGQIESLEAEQFVFHFDDAPGGIFGIVDGGIGALIPTMGSTFRLATILRPGVWFGHGPLLRGRRRTLSFRATEPSTLMRVDLAALNELRSAHPETTGYFASLSEQGTEVAIQVVHDLLIPDTGRRIAATLLRVAGVHDNPAAGKLRKIRLSQTELAEMANTSRHSANRALGFFEQSGWIAVSYRHIQLLDPISLAEFAHGSDE
jgi:CRP-like cAMP-binding protein